MKVLVTGGSGYLGQFIVQSLCNNYDVALLYQSKKLSNAELERLGGPVSFQVDLKTGAGLDEVLRDFGVPDVIVNCAAISVPRDCEKDPRNAEGINVPLALIACLTEAVGSLSNPPLLIHLSTDQVYGGTKQFNTEDDDPNPVNTYGITKLKAEKAIQDKWSNFVILRSSIIVGPSPPVSIPKGLPLQWISSVLSSGQATEFFNDEYRCPVFVLDIVHVVEQLITDFRAGKVVQLLLNMGGPERLSRSDMARAVARVLGYNESLIIEVPAASVNRGVKSPSDISMDISRLRTHVQCVELTSYAEAIRKTFASS